MTTAYFAPAQEPKTENPKGSVPILPDTDTAYRSWLWLANPKPLERGTAAKLFADRVRDDDDVCEVWLVSTKHDLEVAILLRDFDLTRELELRGRFIDVICDLLDPTEGELSVYPFSGDVPSWVRESKRL